LEFAFDQENGVIIDKATGERCLTFAKPILEHIFLRLKELFQSGSHVIIAEAFRAAGKWYVSEVPEEARTDLTAFLSLAVKRFRDSGIGRIEIVDFSLEKAQLHFRIWNNIFAEMCEEHSTYCFGVEAYVSGIFEQLIGVPPQIRKAKCLGKGDPYCEWYLSPPTVEE
jgi:predicted hydrocarbon binding protein